MSLIGIETGPRDPQSNGGSAGQDRAKSRVKVQAVLIVVLPIAPLKRPLPMRRTLSLPGRVLAKAIVCLPLSVGLQPPSRVCLQVAVCSPLTETTLKRAVL